MRACQPYVRRRPPLEEVECTHRHTIIKTFYERLSTMYSSPRTVDSVDCLPCLLRKHVCGDASVFCPEGSSAPTTVSEGFYTVQGRVGGTDRHLSLGVAETRTSQVREPTARVERQQDAGQRVGRGRAYPRSPKYTSSRFCLKFQWMPRRALRVDGRRVSDA